MTYIGYRIDRSWTIPQCPPESALNVFRHQEYREREQSSCISKERSYPARHRGRDVYHYSGAVFQKSTAYSGSPYRVKPPGLFLHFPPSREGTEVHR